MKGASKPVPQKWVDLIVQGQKQALELMVYGASLESVLEVLARTVELESRGETLASILLVDADGVHLRHGAAPSLPAAYNRAIDGVAIGPSVGSCGTAAHTRQLVIVTDIGKDPLWADYKQLALKHGLHACWSMPIFSSHGKLLGTFALYKRRVGAPTPSEHEMIELLAHTAAIVIERAQEINQRMEAERSLRESNLKYRQLVYGLSSAVYTCDAQGHINLYNQAAAELWGKKPSLGKGQWCGSYKILRPDGTQLPLESSPMAVVLKGGQRADGEEIIIERPDGTRRNVLSHPSPLLDDAGNLVGAVNMLVDITERKRAETELRAAKDSLTLQVKALTQLHDLSMLLAGPLEEERNLKSILKTLVELHGADFGLLALHNPATGFLYEGASVGFSPEALVQLSRVMPDPQAGASGSAFATRKRAVVEDTEQDFRFEKFRKAARDAGFRAAHSTPILTRRGEILGVLSVYFKSPRLPAPHEIQIADMCARHAANIIETSKDQEILRESEQRFRTMADNAPFMIWVSDPQGNRTFLSKSWYEVTGRRPDSGLGFGWLEALHPEDRNVVRDAYMAAIQQKAPFQKDFRMLCKNGEYLWFFGAAVPRFTGDGEFLGYIGSTVDITQRKAAEEQVQTLNAQLEKKVADRTRDMQKQIETRQKIEEQLRASLTEKEVLLKEIHHRVKNNMQVISSFLRLQSELVSEKEGAVGSAVRQLFEGSQGRIRSMALVHELLYQTKDFTAIPIKHYVNNLAIFLLQSYGYTHAVSLELDIRRHSLDLDAAVPFGLILTELITNALKYAFTESGAGQRLKVSARDDNRGRLELIVENNGRPMPSDISLENSPSLGFLIIRSLVDQLGGEWRVERSETATKFVILLHPNPAAISPAEN